MGDIGAALLAATVLFAATAVAVLGDRMLAARAAGGPLGRTLFSLPADVARLLVTQRRRTTTPDLLLWRLGVAAIPVAALLAVLVIPVGGHAAGDLGIGVVWFNAMEVLLWAGVWLAGWGPNSAFSLIGGYRFVAQGLAYELPHMFALITVATLAGSLRVGNIVGAQQHLWFVVFAPVAFAVYLGSVLAMSFSAPFDAPVGADLAGGADTELAGPDRLVLRTGRWLLLTAGAAFAVPLFLGGGHGPGLPPIVWSVLKTIAVLAALLTVRRRFPTIRMERFAEVSWTVLVPLTIAQALFASIAVLEGWS